MDILIDESSEIKVTLYISGKNFWTENINENNYKKSDAEKQINFYFRLPNYQDDSFLNDAAIHIEPSGRVRIVSEQVKFLKMQRLIKKWDLKDAKDQVVPLTEESVSSLSPKIGTIVSLDLEKQLSSM
jgi:hypothetical protein